MKGLENRFKGYLGVRWKCLSGQISYEKRVERRPKRKTDFLLSLHLV